MKANRLRCTLVAAMALLAGVAGCADDASIDQPAPAAESMPTERARGDHVTETESTTGPVDDTREAPIELTHDDVAGLLWMREEEQLAHDVYSVLGEQWGLRIFDNIASSERSHIERVVGLLDRYGIEDPMTGRPGGGTFTIPAMQELFDELVADGRTSLVDALAAGALIEETDIVDLRARSTDVDDIQAVYTRLEQGSQRHLRAFVSQLEARDVAYQPTLLDVGAYDEILSGA